MIWYIHENKNGKKGRVKMTRKAFHEIMPNFPKVRKKKKA